MGNNSPTVIKTSTNSPKLSLQCQSIGLNTTTIRSLDWERSRFDIEFGLRNGTTYNSFIIQGEKTVLIDSSHVKFKDIWLKILQEKIYFRPNEVHNLIGNYSKSKKILKWKPKINFDKLISEMVESDLKLIK